MGLHMNSLVPNKSYFINNLDQRMSQEVLKFPIIGLKIFWPWFLV
jgi:hypothetical protein